MEEREKYYVDDATVPRLVGRVDCLSACEVHTYLGVGNACWKYPGMEFMQDIQDRVKLAEREKGRSTSAD